MKKANAIIRYGAGVHTLETDTVTFDLHAMAYATRRVLAQAISKCLPYVKEPRQLKRHAHSRRYTPVQQ